MGCLNRDDWDLCVHSTDAAVLKPPPKRLRRIVTRCLWGGATSNVRRYAPETDFTRQGIAPEGSEAEISPWRPCYINADYSVCPTYPRVWYVPRCLDDGTIRESAKFRSKGRCCCALLTPAGVAAGWP